MLAQKRVLLTDTTMRDAHQSLLATRMRSHRHDGHRAVLRDACCRSCSRSNAGGGATFDVAMRFLTEDPGSASPQLREAMPNLLLQMLLRSANAVGYTNYPDNVVRFFVKQAAERGIDVFRIFDSLNWVENMRVSIDAVLETGKLCEAAICYTGNSQRSRTRRSTRSTITSKLARELKAAGTHILGVKDMAGLCRPRAAHTLVKALKDEIGLPVHFHTHDTSGIAAASVLAAIEAGADAVDGALDSMSGLTSQPNLGSIVEALRHGPHDTRNRPGEAAHAVLVLGAGPAQLRGVRERHPLRRLRGVCARHAGRPVHEPARTGSLARHRGRPLARGGAGLRGRQRDVRRHRQGDADLEGRRRHGDPDGDERPHQGSRCSIRTPRSHFPQSVVQLFRGDLGQPHGGFPAGAAEEDPRRQNRRSRAGPARLLPPVDLDAEREKVQAEAAAAVRRTTTWPPYLMYPKVWTDTWTTACNTATSASCPRRCSSTAWSRVRRSPWTSSAARRSSCAISRPAKRMTMTHAHGVLRAQRPAALRAGHGSQPEGLDGPCSARRSRAMPEHVGAPMPGTIATIAVTVGQKVARGDALVTIEAMKMETAVRADGRWRSRRKCWCGWPAGGCEGPAGGDEVAIAAEAELVAAMGMSARRYFDWSVDQPLLIDRA